MMYTLPTSLLQQESTAGAVLDAAVVAVGRKPPSDGMAMAADGTLYYGALTLDG